MSTTVAACFEASTSPTLVTTGDTDDRVTPLHAFKLVAALQHAQASAAPVLLRVEERAGHGDRGKPVSRRIEEVTDQFTFLARSLGFRWRRSRDSARGRFGGGSDIRGRQ